MEKNVKCKCFSMDEKIIEEKPKVLFSQEFVIITRHLIS
jgi:hypothetical protein